MKKDLLIILIGVVILCIPLFIMKVILDIKDEYLVTQGTAMFSEGMLFGVAYAVIVHKIKPSFTEENKKPL